MLFPANFLVFFEERAQGTVYGHHLANTTKQPQTDIENLRVTFVANTQYNTCVQLPLLTVVLIFF